MNVARRVFRILMMACLLILPAASAETPDPASITRKVVLSGKQPLRVQAEALATSAFNFDSPDAWLFIDGIAPSKVISTYLNRILVYYEKAVVDGNVRVVPYGNGTVIIPHGPAYAAMSVFSERSLSGQSQELKCHVAYGDSKHVLLASIRSFRLKHGYMATIATNADGTGISRNYVAQDDDVEVRTLPEELDGKVRFVRIFPWRWTVKKGIAGGISKGLNVGWFYDWNIGARTTADLEYVPIKQNANWPGLNQDWKGKGSVHLLGFNEPDHKDQSNLTVDQAIQGWPGLLKTGLRLGSPAVSDGGLSWLYQFMAKADAAKLRVDFIAVHYYRSVEDPGDGRAAAAQMEAFLEDIHKRTRRPIWITEWNNGANWTKHRDPNEKEQARAIAKMIEMLDKLPYVERYALYNWVEDCRMVQRNDGSLTPAGEVYRDHVSKTAYQQVK
jgi:hypothetical protein